MDALILTDLNEEVPEELKTSLSKHEVAHLNGSESTPSPLQPGSSRVHPLPLLSLSPDNLVAGKLSHFLERLTRPRMTIGGRDWSSYHIFGGLGILLAGVIALSLTIFRELSAGIMLTLFALAAAISWLNVTITKKVTGKDRLVFLRYFIPILAGSIIFLRLVNQPVVVYLEPLMLGVGAMQGIGRIGCFMVGCCHGKPFPIGFQYSEIHSRYGFPRRLLGIRFFPVQLLESIWILLSVGTGIYLVLAQSAPGLGLSVYLLFFSIGRFCLELIRGDRWRRQFGLFSEAQWVSYAIVSAVLLLSRFDVLPYRAWYLLAWIAITCLAAGIYYRQKKEGFPLDSPKHRSEIIRALAVLEKGRRLGSAGEAVHMRTTSASLQLSLGWTLRPREELYHYTLSFADRPMRLRDARILTNIIGNWHPHSGKATLIQEKSHIFHLIRFTGMKSQDS